MVISKKKTNVKNGQVALLMILIFKRKQYLNYILVSLFKFVNISSDFKHVLIYKLSKLYSWMIENIFFSILKTIFILNSHEI